MYTLVYKQLSLRALKLMYAGYIANILEENTWNFFVAGVLLQDRKGRKVEFFVISKVAPSI